MSIAIQITVQTMLNQFITTIFENLNIIPTRWLLVVSN